MNTKHVSPTGAKPTPRDVDRKGKIAQVKTVKRRPQIKGLVRHARQLGVTRVHLRMVIIGERSSKRLTQRYKDLLAFESVSTVKGKTDE